MDFQSVGGDKHFMDNYNGTSILNFVATTECNQSDLPTCMKIIFMKASIKLKYI